MGGEAEPEDAVLFVGVSLVLGIASRHLLRGTHVPYTVALLVLGVTLGSLGKAAFHSSFIRLSFSSSNLSTNGMEWNFRNKRIQLCPLKGAFNSVAPYYNKYPFD
jgi:hypothetical protein